MQEDLVKIGELARRSGVSIATLKHYLREGLIRPARKSGRTMSWYDPALVDRLRAIRELQTTRFLPLDVIRETLDGTGNAQDDLTAAEAIAGVLDRHTGSRARSKQEVLERGANPRELAWLDAMGLAKPSESDQCYRGDDLALLMTLAAARRAGITARMLPFEILDRYLAALRALVTVELEMFRVGVFPNAKPGELAKLTTAATKLSERLVLLLRRKLLLPTLKQLSEAQPNASSQPKGPAPRPRARARKLQQQQHAAPGRRSKRHR